MIEAARAAGQARVTPRSVYRGAGRVTYRTKLTNLRSDAGGDSQQLAGISRSCRCTRLCSVPGSG